MKFDLWNEKERIYQLLFLTVLIVVIMLIAGCGMTEKSGLSNCVVVEKEDHFTGEWLRHSRAVYFGRMKTPECVRKDQEIDQGDGPRKGKVRWAECMKGPDCDEAGLF
ncbi:MAG TPA: hypothetical protein PKN70_08900 [Smithellaceae bacterium]|jgi:hypothetical protein|nr:hypothetical protein [Smithellaceae bacterium]HQM45558.1 hypothetical protein [Smithellaceae bacterium]